MDMSVFLPPGCRNRLFVANLAGPAAIGLYIRQNA